MTDVGTRPAQQPAAPGGTLTFLFSDIEGSTRLLDQLGSAACTAVLEREAGILRAAFERHGGREEGTEGDSFFVLFDNAREAVLAAVEGQRDLAAESWPAGVESDPRAMPRTSSLSDPPATLGAWPTGGVSLRQRTVAWNSRASAPAG